MRVPTGRRSASVPSVLRPYPVLNTRPGRTAWLAVHHLLAVREQSGGDVPADPVDPRSPTPAPPTFSRAKHRGVASDVGGVAAAEHRLTPGAVSSIVADRLLGSIAE
jgi:hypothetical protein